jgi:hypothetical protein
MQALLPIFSICLLYSINICGLTLDEIAIKTGTDKSSTWHNYTEIYQKYFEPLRKHPIKFLEIGIDKGASVLMWDIYFEHQDSQLFFIDINPNAVQNCNDFVANKILTSRVRNYVADQSNKEQLVNLIELTGGDFDIIIDDGGHRIEQQVTSFIALFPFVKKGGFYIIEDLLTSFWPSSGGAMIDNNKVAPHTTIRFLTNLVDDINYIGAMNWCADTNKSPNHVFQNYYQRHIKSITFYNSICFVEKY